MTVALPDTGDGAAAAGDEHALAEILDGRSAVVCGPGLGQAAPTRAFVAEVVRRTTAPLVLDADGLNNVAGTGLLSERAGPTVLTPHPGEMARLVGSDVPAVQRDRIAASRALARASGAVVVLKGAHTIIASPDGGVAISPTGNPGMASGGTGDVLAGVLGGFIAQGLTPYDAAALGVFVHGAAADAVAARQGEVGLLARDILAELPATIARLQILARPDVRPRRGYRAGT
jgi:NAD(P)H-hydrate epimerase